jgi:hypothetical protein
MNTEIVKYGQGIWDVENIRRMADLLRKMLPGGERLSDGEVLALAQAARVMGRNPLAGEIWAIAGKGVTDGYRGLIKDAKPGSYTYRYRNPKPNEITAHEIRERDIARICELYIFEEARQCRELGIPYEPVTGIGIVREEERYQTEAWDASTRRRIALPREKWQPIAPPTGRSWFWRAEIRALKDALRRAGLAYAEYAEEEEIRVTANEVMQLEEGKRQREEYIAATEQTLGPEIAREVAKAQVQQDIDDLYGPDPDAPEQAPKPQEFWQFWQIPEAWRARLMERANEETNGYYNHIMHVENTLRKEGFAAVDKANVTRALQALVKHAQMKAEATERA